MFLTHFGNGIFLYQEFELPIMNIIKMILKHKITTLKNLIKMRQMTLNYPKYDIKKLLEPCLYLLVYAKESPKFFISFRS